MATTRDSASLMTSISAAINPKCNLQTKASQCVSSPAAAKGYTNAQKEEVIIIGAGVAGLATAVMLHKFGIKARVLEQADSLRTGETSLVLSKNAWDALDDIGVADNLRSPHFKFQGVVIKTELGRKLCVLKMPDDESQELRAVLRRELLQALSDQLPPNTVEYSSRLASIDKAKTGEALLTLTDGTQLSAEVVVGCDGIRSKVAKWMGFAEPKYVGQCILRGLGVFPEEYPLKPVMNYVYGRGLRAAYYSVSPTKINWFITHISPHPGQMISDPSQLKQKARDLVRNWTPELLEFIDHTPENMITENPLEDRWLWPGITPSASTGGVVVVGDAWHPMTPNLGQGACSALEDAVFLSRKIHGALRGKQESVEEALESFGRERWPAVFKLGIKSNLVGAFVQWENPVACYLRNEFIMRKLVPFGQRVEPTYFD